MARFHSITRMTIGTWKGIHSKNRYAKMPIRKIRDRKFEISNHFIVFQNARSSLVCSNGREPSNADSYLALEIALFWSFRSQALPLISCAASYFVSPLLSQFSLSTVFRAIDSVSNSIYFIGILLSIFNHWCFFLFWLLKYSIYLSPHAASVQPLLSLRYLCHNFPNHNNSQE